MAVVYGKCLSYFALSVKHCVALVLYIGSPSHASYLGECWLLLTFWANSFNQALILIHIKPLTLRLLSEEHLSIIVWHCFEIWKDIYMTMCWDATLLICHGFCYAISRWKHCWTRGKDNFGEYSPSLYFIKLTVQDKGFDIRRKGWISLCQQHLDYFCCTCLCSIYMSILGDIYILFSNTIVHLLT